MDHSKSKAVEEYLKNIDIHQRWINKYLTQENDRFFELVFEYIVHVLHAPKNSIILDVGCGNCDKSIRLANYGFLVKAVDISEDILKMGGINVKAKNLEDRIDTKKENLRFLSFENEVFDYILCWGVLMHIPDIETAIAELARVLKPKGMLIIGENNIYSFQSMVKQIFRYTVGRSNINIKRTAAGAEFWNNLSGGILMTRLTNMRWLTEQFRRKGIYVKQHVAGQFTEIYTRISIPLLKRAIHGLNNFWFKYIKIPHLALGNILILQKENRPS